MKGDWYETKAAPSYPSPRQLPKSLSRISVFSKSIFYELTSTANELVPGSLWNVISIFTASFLMILKFSIIAPNPMTQTIYVVTHTTTSIFLKI